MGWNPKASVSCRSLRFRGDLEAGNFIRRQNSLLLKKLLFHAALQTKQDLHLFEAIPSWKHNKKCKTVTVTTTRKPHLYTAFPRLGFLPLSGRPLSLRSAMSSPGAKSAEKAEALAFRKSDRMLEIDQEEGAQVLPSGGIF